MTGDCWFVPGLCALRESGPGATYWMWASLFILGIALIVLAATSWLSENFGDKLPKLYIERSNANRHSKTVDYPPADNPTRYASLEEKIDQLAEQAKFNAEHNRQLAEAKTAVEDFTKNLSKLRSLKAAMDAPPSARQEVDRNYDVFVEIQPTLLAEHTNKYALMSGGELVGVYSTLDDAYTTARKFLTDGRFSVQKITNIPVDLGFFHMPHKPERG